MQELRVEQTTRCHHWILQAADGPFRLGICMFCSEEREFKNSQDDLWDFEKLRQQCRDSFDFN